MAQLSRQVETGEIREDEGGPSLRKARSSQYMWMFAPSAWSNKKLKMLHFPDAEAVAWPGFEPKHFSATILKKLHGVLY